VHTPFSDWYEKELVDVFNTGGGEGGDDKEAAKPQEKKEEKKEEETADGEPKPATGTPYSHTHTCMYIYMYVCVYVCMYV
jgi:hypothetical protein